MSQLAVGDVLERRYRIDHPIARGGMSTVYRCVDLRLSREVAAKVMDARFVDDPVFRDRFRREAQAMAQLKHPNLVDVYDFSSEDDDVYLVMELITGGTLRELLAERGPMPPHAATAVMRFVLTGLSVAHAKGMVHRDIKPDNVLINGDHSVKLGDFGLVRGISAAATNNEIIGTVAYLSPEQVDGSEISPASDVYSAGIVMFELLTGTTPFSGGADYAHAMARLEEDMPLASSRIDGIPPLFDELVATATRRDPEDRFTDAGEFLAALDDVAEELRLPSYTVPIPRNSAAHRATEVPTDTTGVIGATGVIPRGGDVADQGPTEVVDDATGVLPAAGQEPLEQTRVVGAAPVAPEPAPVQGPLEEIGADAPATQVSDEHTERGDAPPPVSNRSPGRLIVGLLMVAVLVAAVGLGGWWFGSGRYGEIPQVFGADRAAAVAQVEEAGFVPATRIVYHNEVPADQTVGTEPPGGTGLLPGEQVVVLVSQGQPTVPEIPGGVSVEDYRALAGERTLSVETGESVYSSDVPVGAVADASPAPGTPVPMNSTVTVAISQGPQPATVPEIEGQGLAEARRMLDEAGLNVGEVTEEFDDRIFGGNVVSVDPGPGTNLERGDRVDLVLSTAVRVPDLAGTSLDDAVDALEDEGFDVDTTRDRDAAGVDFDAVVGISPDPGTLLDPEEDMEVTVTVPGRIPAPNVVGLSVADAREVLEDAGLRISGASRRDDPDTVQSQNPAAGEDVSQRARIRVEHE